MSNIVEYMRQKSVESLFNTGSFNNSFQTWKPQIRAIVGEPPSIGKVIDLGDHLSDIFQSTGEGGRSQSSVSSGGTAWEGLVCWYLNLCLIGTRSVVVKQLKEILPLPLKKSMTVRYGNFPSNTEADLVGITFPNMSDYAEDISEITVNDESGNEISREKRGGFNYLPIINGLCERDIEGLELAIIQCKTNWNDNAQIPMLWDMVYSSSGFPGRNITIGDSAFSIDDLNKFTYSFVTVPSNDRSQYKTNSTSVKRVNQLSGGNYWGYPTKSGVSNSIKEIFGKVFASGTSRGGIRSTLRSNLPNLDQDFSYFEI